MRDGGRGGVEVGMLGAGGGKEEDWRKASDIHGFVAPQVVEGVREGDATFESDSPRRANGLAFAAAGVIPLFERITLLGTGLGLIFFCRACLFFPPAKKAPSLLGATWALWFVECGLVDCSSLGGGEA